MDADTQRVLEYLTQIEEAAEDVLSTKQQVTVETSISRQDLQLTLASVYANWTMPLWRD